MHTLEQLRSGALAGTRRLDLADTLEMLNQNGNRIARVLCAVQETEVFLLHAFVKKTQQATPADIE